MTLVLDASGLSAPAGQRARLHELRRRGLWPAQAVDAVVVAAAERSDAVVLTSDPNDLRALAEHDHPHHCRRVAGYPDNGR